MEVRLVVVGVEKNIERRGGGENIDGMEKRRVVKKMRER
jgi:hypothetical protein